MSLCAKETRRVWLEACVRRFDTGCACGWTASTNDGWNALAEWYRHVGILPGPPSGVGQ